MRAALPFLLISFMATGAESRRLDLLIFVTHDCPISNAFAPEIGRICKEYEPKGVRCELVYSDPASGLEAVKAHQADYGLGQIPAVVDRDHAIAKQVGATVTPEAAVVDGSRVLYRGRIDDRYVAWGKSRREAGQRDLRRALDQSIAGKTISVPRTKAIGCYITRAVDR